MLYSAELRLKVNKTNETGIVTGRHILSLFLKLVENVNPALSEELHKDSPIKPFTLSSLLPVTGRRKITLKEGNTVSFRITALDEKVFATLADAVWRLSPDDDLKLGGLYVKCDSLATTPAQSKWATFISFEQMLKNASKETSIRLEYLSPTTFRSSGRGERNILFPEPRLVFKSLLSKWNTFTDKSLKIDLPDTAINSIKASFYTLKTQILDFGDYQERGFTGKVTYECLDNLSEAQILTFNALADFAFYCGTGAKTTMGMGQTRRIK